VKSGISLAESEARIKQIFIDFFMRCLNRGGRFFFINTDWESEEQVLCRLARLVGSGIVEDSLVEDAGAKGGGDNPQIAGDAGVDSDNPRIARIYPYYKYSTSPSVRICQDVFKSLVGSGVFDEASTKATRLLGDAIKYESIEEAIEVFCDFHLEGQFSGDGCRRIERFLHGEFERLVEERGELVIGCGFWVFEGRRR